MVYTTATMIVMIMVVPFHESPEFTWLLVPVIFVFQFFLNLGISLVMARVGFIFPDTAQFMSLIGTGVHVRLRGDLPDRPFRR